MYVVDNKNNYTVAGHSGVKTVVVKCIYPFLEFSHVLNLFNVSGLSEKLV